MADKLVLHSVFLVLGLLALLGVWWDQAVQGERG